MHRVAPPVLHLFGVLDACPTPGPPSRPPVPRERDDTPPKDAVAECPICYEAFAEARCVRSTCCDNDFHRACAARWRRSCPLCRSADQFQDIEPVLGFGDGEDTLTASEPVRRPSPGPGLPRPNGTVDFSRVDATELSIGVTRAAVTLTGSDAALPAPLRPLLAAYLPALWPHPVSPDRPRAGTGA